ncbi:MAG TPA: serine hydrolase domain-containing protein [Chthoniobacterales bacterium]
MTPVTGISSPLAQSTTLDKELDNVIGAALALNRAVGTVIMVARRGQVAYQRAAGFADRGARLLAQPDTIFRFASLTKPMVSAAALVLVDQGKLAGRHGRSLRPSGTRRRLSRDHAVKQKTSRKDAKIWI